MSEVRWCKQGKAFACSVVCEAAVCPVISCFRLENPADLNLYILSLGSPAGSSCSYGAASREAAHRLDQHPRPNPDRQQDLHDNSGTCQVAWFDSQRESRTLLLVIWRRFVNKTLFLFNSWLTWAHHSSSGVQRTRGRTTLHSSISPSDPPHDATSQDLCLKLDWSEMHDNPVRLAMQVLVSEVLTVLF